MDGNVILSVMRAAYAHFSTYQDTGNAVSIFIHDTPQPRRRTYNQPFSTLFVRPNRFRIGFAEQDAAPGEEWTRFVVCERDGSAHARRSAKNEEISGDLATLLAGATGYSGAEAIRVPRLLMPERLLQNASVSAKLVGTEAIDGVVCNMLELSWNHGERAFGETWWVGKHDHLLRKVFNTKHLRGESAVGLQSYIRDNLTKAHAEGKITRERLEELLRPVVKPLEPCRVESTTNYAPIINRPISDDLFHFAPPN